MASESELTELIQLGHDMASLKLYTAGLVALWVYDYFLTLDDEVRYAWKIETAPTFVLFLLARYLPALYLVWLAVSTWSPSYTPEKTAFLEPMYFTFVTAFSQVVLAQRTYAITLKNKWIASFLYTLATVQFCLGVYFFVYNAMNPAAASTGPLELYRFCVNNAKRGWTTAQITLSLVFDIAVFVPVVVQAQIFKPMYRGTRGPNAFRTLSRDAMIYFTVMSSSHFLIFVMFFAARPSSQYTAQMGYAVFIPMMTARTIISLKKAASSREPHLSLRVPTEFLAHSQDANPLRPVTGIRLSVFKSGGL